MMRGMKIKSKTLLIYLAILVIPSRVFAIASCPPDPGGSGMKGFSTIFSSECVYGYEAWLSLVWGWAMGILIPISVLIFTAAGVIYITSEGDSGRVGLAKKMIIGVLSGVGLLILGRFFLTILFGDAAKGGWTF